MKSSLLGFVVVLVLGRNVVVGFSCRGWSSCPSCLFLKKGDVNRDVFVYNETLLSKDGMRYSDEPKDSKRRKQREESTSTTLSDQSRKTSNQHEELAQCLLDPVTTIQDVRRIKHESNINDWMQQAVRTVDRPFCKWSVKSQIDFVKVLQDFQAYESIMLFLCHLGKPSVKVCTTAMFSMALSVGHRHLAAEILDLMDEQEVQPTTLTFIALLGSIDGAKATSQIMKRIENYKDVQLSAEVYNSAIFACKRKAAPNDTSNDWQTALNLLQTMRRKRIQPTVKTYHATLQVLAGTGQVQMAKSIMQQLLSTPNIKPDDRVWAAAMNVCADALDYKGAIDFINQMQATGHRPNLMHASILLKAFALSGQDDMSLCALEMMTRLDNNTTNGDNALAFYLPRISPDLIALNTIISACAKAGNIQGALAVVDRMKDGEFQDPITGKIISPDRISYHNILSSCKNPETAMLVVKEVRSTRLCEKNPFKP